MATETRGAGPGGDRFGLALATVALGAAAGWMAAVGTGSPARAGNPPAAAGGDLLVLPAETGTPGVQTLFVIDQRQRVVSVYEYDARKPKLKLAAVRHVAADHQLSEYNNDAPFVADIEKLTRQR